MPIRREQAFSAQKISDSAVNGTAELAKSHCKTELDLPSVQELAVSSDDEKQLHPLDTMRAKSELCFQIRCTDRDWESPNS